MPHVTRTWEADGGYDGDGWPQRIVEKFENLMRNAAIKRKGYPAIVEAWDDGRGARCWYSARVCREETWLHERCRRLFGRRERE